MHVKFIEQSGQQKDIANVAPSQSLMQVGRANDVAGILADCGGGCSCATCHVYVDQAWMERVGAPNDIENEMLDMVSDLRKPNSRLSCQIDLRPELDGLVVTVAPT